MGRGKKRRGPKHQEAHKNAYAWLAYRHRSVLYDVALDAAHARQRVCNYYGMPCSSKGKRRK